MRPRLSRPSPAPASYRGATGPRGATGATGATGAPGTARAYGLVAPDGTLSRSKNATVSVPDAATLPGHYCITVQGVNLSDAPIVATPDAPNAGTYWGGAASGIGDQSVVETNSNGGVCPNPNQFEVITGVIDFNNGTAVSANQTPQGFHFVVP